MLKFKTYKKNYTGCLYRTHSFLDLLDLQYVDYCLQNMKELNIQIDTIFATYDGHTIFSLFNYNSEVYEKILSIFASQDFEDELNYLNQYVENS